MTSIYGPTTFGMMTQVVGNTASIKQQLDTLTEQSSSGLVSTTYAGLGNHAPLSLDLNAEIAQNGTWQSNIQAASASLNVAQSALSQIGTIASGISSQLLDLNGGNVEVVAAQARDALTQIAGLLDTQSGDSYVFAGQDSANPPVPDPSAITSSNFYTAISTAVAGLSSNGAAATEAQTLAIASAGPGGVSPFSATLTASNQRSQVQVGTDQTVTFGILADQNATAVSPGTGSTSTGSYIRDIMRSLATIGSLSSAQSSDPNFATLVQNTSSSLQSAVQTLNSDSGIMGDTQSNLTAMQSTLSDTSTAMSTQVNNLQSVDMASVASQLSEVQTQLQASYKIISELSSLSLVNFLPT